MLEACVECTKPGLCANGLGLTPCLNLKVHIFRLSEKQIYFSRAEGELCGGHGLTHGADVSS